MYVVTINSMQLDLKFLKAEVIDDCWADNLVQSSKSYVYKKKKKEKLNIKKLDSVRGPSMMIVSMRGPEEKRKTHNHKTIDVVSSSPATASLFASLGKILNLNLLRGPERIWCLWYVWNTTNIT